MRTTERIDRTPQEAERPSERPSRKELLDEIRSRPKIVLDPTPADIIREERDRR